MFVNMPQKLSSVEKKIESSIDRYDFLSSFQLDSIWLRKNDLSRLFHNIKYFFKKL